jgi:hypothetical protein
MAIAFQMAPSLEPEAVEYEALLKAVDGFARAKIQGLEQFSEGGFEVTVVGVDVVRGIVARQADGSLEAGAKIYLELKRSKYRSTDTIRANVKFHTENGAPIVDAIIAAQRVP